MAHEYHWMCQERWVGTKFGCALGSDETEYPLAEMEIGTLPILGTEVIPFLVILTAMSD